MFFLNSSFFLNLFLDQMSIFKGLFNFNYFSEPESPLSDVQWNLFLMAQIRNNFSPINLQGLSCSLLHDFFFHFKHNILILNCNSELYYIYLFATSLMIMYQKGRGYKQMKEWLRWGLLNYIILKLVQVKWCESDNTENTPHCSSPSLSCITKKWLSDLE